MNASELSTKKITLSTLKSFVRKNATLFVQELSSFDGMTDMVEHRKKDFVQVTKEDAIGLKGVYVVGSGNNNFSFWENATHYGIKVYNCCGSGILATAK